MKRTCASSAFTFLLGRSAHRARENPEARNLAIIEVLNKFLDKNIGFRKIKSLILWINANFAEFLTKMLTIDDASKLLTMPKTTIKRWIRQGKIPVEELNGEYFFAHKALEKWARKHHIFLHGSVPKASSQNIQPEGRLCDAMKRGGVFFHIKAGNTAEVLKKTVHMAPLPLEVDKEFLIDLLLQREKLSSTGVGAGVAISHPRYPLENLFSNAVITTCFLDQTVDFKAIDGEYIFVVFMLLSPTTRMHLHYLSRLSFCLRNPSFVSFLRKCNDDHAFYHEVEKIEAALDDG